MDTQQQTAPEDSGNIVIPKVAVLKLMAAYLPYIAIMALAAVIIVMYKDMRADFKERLNDQKIISGEYRELNTLWKDAFFSTLDVAKNPRPQGHESSNQDSSMHAIGAPSR